MRFKIVTNIILPLIFGVVMLYYYQSNTRKSSEIGLGKGTESYAPFVNQYPIHIINLYNRDSLVKGWISRGRKDIFLWQGNSQLHGINQYSHGQINCIEYIFDSLSHNNKEVLGASYPNGNMQEFLLSAIYFIERFPVKGIIQPVFYDDMREDGIRGEMNVTDIRKYVLKDSAFYYNISSINNLKVKDTSPDIMNDGFKGIQQTVQDKTERFLDSKLEQKWNLWASRPDIRGNLFNDVYFFRNTLLRIKANTVRKMIPGRYKDNYNSFLNF